mgnify:CR=1 FL=1
MEGGRSDLDSLLSNARAQHDIPALAAVVVRSDSILAYGATGIRRKGFSAPVSPYDWFHLGSSPDCGSYRLAGRGRRAVLGYNARRSSVPILL